MGILCSLFYSFLNAIYFKYFWRYTFINNQQPKKGENLINEEITASLLLVIDENGEQLGRISREEALEIAYERGYDLVCVAANAEVPVCKLMDYSRYRYQQQKKAKEAKKNQKIIEIKEVRLSPTIDIGDYNTKVKAALKFLEAGNKVKVSCRFRGRMIEQANNTKTLFLDFASKLEEISQIDNQPVLDGRNMTMVLSPKVQKKKN